MSTWLENYYGQDFARLSPEVIFDGVAWAVVKLKKAATMTTGASVGYVMVNKKGTHQSSAYLPLLNRSASKEELEWMNQLLKRRETGLRG